MIAKLESSAQNSVQISNKNCFSIECTKWNSSVERTGAPIQLHFARTFVRELNLGSRKVAKLFKVAQNKGFSDHDTDEYMCIMKFTKPASSFNQCWCISDVPRNLWTSWTDPESIAFPIVLWFLSSEMMSRVWMLLLAFSYIIICIYKQLHCLCYGLYMVCLRVLPVVCSGVFIFFYL